MALDTDPDEEILIDTRPSWLASLIKGVVISTLLVRYGNRLTVTNKQVYKRKGIIRKNESFIRAEDIRDVGMKQGILGRFLRFGTINVSTAGTGGTEIKFSGVGKPSKVRDKINEMRRNAE